MRGKTALLPAILLAAFGLGAAAMPTHLPFGTAKESQSLDVTDRLESLLSGGSLTDVAILGVRPGADVDAAAALLKTEWNFEPAVGLDGAKQFHPGHAARARLKQTSQRNGGMLRMDTREGRVGPVLFLEYFMRPIDARAARDWLTSRFGEPDRERRLADGHHMVWSGDTLRLQVDIVKEMEPFARRAGYEGKLAFTLWDVGYETYVSEVRLRCNAFRGVSVDRMTPVTRAWYQDNCPLAQ